MAEKPVCLEPVDLDRCQAEILSYNPFIMGGNVYRRERCKNAAQWLVTEIVTHKDGQKGAMSMCDDCAEIFIRKRQLPPTNYEMEWICK